MGMATRVDLIRVRRLLQCINLPFQAGSLSAILSVSGCKVAFGNFSFDRGIPKYWMGNSFTGQGKSSWAARTFSLLQQMGTNWHLEMLQARPAEASNIWKITLASCKSYCTWLRKSTKLLAYIETQNGNFLGGSFWNSDYSSAFRNRPLSTFMTSRKSIGCRGSPWRSPLAW
jgi:hypothetical protein